MLPPSLTMVKNCLNLDQWYKHIQGEAKGKGGAKGKGEAKGKAKGEAKEEAKGEEKGMTKTNGKVCQNREHKARWGHCKGQGRHCHLFFVGSMVSRTKALARTPQGLKFLMGSDSD